jgi:hypothetical protein
MPGGLRHPRSAFLTAWQSTTTLLATATTVSAHRAGFLPKRGLVSGEPR